MTVRFKNELVRNITIKLGYANAKVRAVSRFRRWTPPSLSSGRHAGLLDNLRRFTNAKTRIVLDRGITARIVQTRRTIRRASDWAVDTE